VSSVARERLDHLTELLALLDRLDASPTYSVNDLERIRRLAGSLGLPTTGWGWDFDRADLRATADAARELAAARSKVPTWDKANKERLAVDRPIADGKCAEAHRLAAAGRSVKQIAKAIDRKPSTVYGYLKRTDCT